MDVCSIKIIFFIFFIQLLNLFFFKFSYIYSHRIIDLERFLLNHLYNLKFHHELIPKFVNDYNQLFLNGLINLLNKKKSPNKSF